jgi:pimeloyl-ACP methyl ester carboxylesterase
MKAQPFQIKVPQLVLDDLQERLAKTRWPDEVNGTGWHYGTNLTYLKELAKYWQNDFNWSQQEAALNKFAHFKTESDGTNIHFIHERGKGPNSTPLLLLHGWPDSFYRFYKIIPMLVDPEKYGGSPDDSFDVIVPSLPGFAFSDRPKGQVSTLLAKLMTEVLGYERFAVHGGDVGSGLTEKLSSEYAASVIGIHLADIPYSHLLTVSREGLSEAEKKYIETGQQWQMTEGAYVAMQATKPQTLTYGLNDSPVGLLAWQVEKFRAWSDCNGEVETRFSKDELLTNATLYWVTQTIGSSFMPYYAQEYSPGTKHSDVPTGVAVFPKNIVSAPREFAERFFNIQHWTELPSGGHFTALEEPELLAADLQEFFRPLRNMLDAVSSDVQNYSLHPNSRGKENDGSR